MAKPAASIEQQKKIKQLQALTFLQGSLISRISHFGKLGYQYDGDRDLYEALGYKTVLDYDDFYAQYVRQDVARAVIDKPISMTWTGALQLLESSDDKDTQLELDWTELEKRLHIKSVFARLDRLTSLGHYGILLFGLDDVNTKEVFAQPVKGGKRNLVYVKPLSEASATVLSWDTDPSSPRYGMPTLYQVSVTTPDGSATEDMRVHFSRVLHVPGEGVLENELQGSPRLEVVFNRLKDLEKLVGGSAEMFWRGARPGYQGKVDTDYQMTSDTVEDLQDQIDEYEHNLRRILVNQGVDLQALTSQVADPSNHVDVQIQMISAVTGIPKRILTGSERGELASTQDRDNWFGVIQSRREEYAEPLIVRPFVDRCIELGILPKAMKGGYSVEWSSLFEQSQEDLANLGKTRAETLKSYSSAPTNQDIIPPDAFLRLMLNLDDDEIDLIQEQQEEMAKQEEKDMAEAEKEAPPEPEAKELVAKQPEEENEKPLTQGGPGSGWHGPPKGDHVGDEESAGGKGKSEYPKTVDEIKGTEFGRGYFIAPDGDLIDISNEFGDATNDHVGSLGMDEYAKKLGLPDEDVKEMKEISKALKSTDFSDDNFDDIVDRHTFKSSEMMMDAFDKGALRVRFFGNQVAIEGRDIPLSKVQDYIADKKLPSDKKATYFIDGASGVSREVEAKLSDLLLAKRWNALKTHKEDLMENGEKPLTQEDLEANWNPNQPRDKNGKWTSTGASGGGCTLPQTDIILGLPEFGVMQKDVVDYVSKNGQEWKAAPLPDGIERGKSKECYANTSRLIMNRSDLDFAEGIAYPANLGGLGFLHAWAVDKKGQVVDSTWDNPAESKYFGVKYPKDKYIKHILKTKIHGVLGGDEKSAIKVLKDGGLK
jgi:uncharacterized protein